MKPHIHAENSAKIFGGMPEDYIEIHKLMDSTKSYIGTDKHRVLAHNTWFISVILPLIFGDTIKNSDAKIVSVVDIGEQHIVEDLGQPFLPTPADWLSDYETPEFGQPFKNKNRKLSKENEKLIERIPPSEISPPFIYPYPTDPYKFPGDDIGPRIVD